MKIQSLDVNPGDLILFEVDLNHYEQNLFKNIVEGLPKSVHAVAIPKDMISQMTIIQKGITFSNEDLHGWVNTPERID